MSETANEDPRPDGCSCYPGERPEPCQREHASTHCWLAWSKTRISALEMENWQLKQALGYPVPSEFDAPQNPFKCGSCDARAQSTR